MLAFSVKLQDLDDKNQEFDYSCAYKAENGEATFRFESTKKEFRLSFRDAVNLCNFIDDVISDNAPLEMLDDEEDLEGAEAEEE